MDVFLGAVQWNDAAGGDGLNLYHALLASIRCPKGCDLQCFFYLTLVVSELISCFDVAAGG